MTHGIEIKGVHLKSSFTPKYVRKSTMRMVMGKPTVMDLQRSNQRRRVPNTKRNRDIIIQDLVNKGYSRTETKIRLRRTERVINGRNYLIDQRAALMKRTLHKDFFALPTRPGILFRRPPVGVKLFANLEMPKVIRRACEKDAAFSIRAEEKNPKKLQLQVNKGRPLFDPGISGGFKIEPMWNGAGLAVVPKD